MTSMNYNITPDTNSQRTNQKVRRIEEESHQTTSKCIGNRKRHDSSQKQETNALEIDGLEGAVAETDANGGARDAHGG